MLETRRFDGKLLAWTRREIWKLTKPRLRLILLLTIMITTFTFTHSSLFSPVKATYIEGLITQDTIWTLTDSPFVVSKNVSVCQSATLTIEPGVEVRFGGDFSINVEGRLQVIGEADNVVTFTSNNDPPAAGDWNTIKFNGTEQTTLAYCVLKHAKDAITIEGGWVNIENCQIGTNSQNAAQKSAIFSTDHS